MIDAASFAPLAEQGIRLNSVQRRTLDVLSDRGLNVRLLGWRDHSVEYVRPLKLAVGATTKKWFGRWEVHERVVWMEIDGNLELE